MLRHQPARLFFRRSRRGGIRIMNPKTTTEILVIDDETSIRKILEITLQSHGYGILQAATAREGLQLTATHSPDLIILDLGLPDESGHTTLKKMREWFGKP